MMRVMSLLAASASALSLAFAPNAAMAQDFSQPPGYGETVLEVGFIPDPFTTVLDAGGPMNAAEGPSGCVGFIAEAPDYRIVYTAGDLPLAFAAIADQDSTLVINAPDASWHCDDDSGGNGNPAIVFPQPTSGQYDIWVGSFNEGEVFPATLGVTEVIGDDGAIAPMELMGAGEGSGGIYGSVDLETGFQPDPFRVQITSGGGVQAASLSGQCAGWVAEQADFQLNFAAGDLPLIISASSMGDTTLVIQGPNGQLYCDDDGGNGDFNPSFSFQAPMAGTYLIWVGSFVQGENHPASLAISELYSE